MKLSNLKFECPKCGGNKLELVTTECMVQTLFELFDEEPCVIYGENEVFDGDFDMIQCADCGYIIQEDGHNVDEDEIHNWVEDQMKERNKSS